MLPLPRGTSLYQAAWRCFDIPKRFASANPWSKRPKMAEGAGPMPSDLVVQLPRSQLMPQHYSARAEQDTLVVHHAFVQHDALGPDDTESQAVTERKSATCSHQPKGTNPALLNANSWEGLECCCWAGQMRSKR
jgi:hypothetical protein